MYKSIILNEICGKSLTATTSSLLEWNTVLLSMSAFFVFEASYQCKVNHNTLQGVFLFFFFYYLFLFYFIFFFENPAGKEIVMSRYGPWPECLYTLCPDVLGKHALILTRPHLKILQRFLERAR